MGIKYQEEECMVKVLDKCSFFKNNKTKEKEIKKLFAFFGELRGVQLNIFNLDIQKTIRKHAEKFIIEVEKRKDVVESEEEFGIVKHWMTRFRINSYRLQDMIDLDREVQMMLMTYVPEF